MCNINAGVNVDFMGLFANSAKTCNIARRKAAVDMDLWVDTRETLNANASANNTTPEIDVSEFPHVGIWNVQILEPVSKLRMELRSACVPKQDIINTDRWKWREITVKLLTSMKRIPSAIRVTATSMNGDIVWKLRAK